MDVKHDKMVLVLVFLCVEINAALCAAIFECLQSWQYSNLKLVEWGTMLLLLARSAPKKSKFLAKVGQRICDQGDQYKQFGIFENS